MLSPHYYGAKPANVQNNNININSKNHHCPINKHMITAIVGNNFFLEYTIIAIAKIVLKIPSNNNKI
jgi:hypothetical protein